MNAIKVEQYISAGYTVSTLTDEVDCSGTELRPHTLARDHTQRRCFPEDWALEWVSMGRSDRLARASEVGLSPDQLDEAMAWATEQFERSFGAWTVCFTLETAREVARRFFGRPTTILGLGLHPSVVDDFIRASAPPPSKPGGAPHGSMGHHLAVLKREPLEESGEAIGFEALAPGWVGLDSLESLHYDETEIRGQADVTLNEAGLAGDLDDARRICAAAGTATDDLWFPGLLTQYVVRPTAID